MQYRTIGKTGVQASALGFGAMRLPHLGKEPDINEPAAIEMIRYALDHGVNYLDTAYVYHGGNGEGLVGKALAGGYREKTHLATKLPVWSVESLDDCDRIFNEQLARLQTDHIDFYLLHCLQKRTWAKMRDLGVVAWAERVRKQGRIRHLGFSFHDHFDVFREIVDAHDWEFCQIQYNYVCEDVQAGTRGLEYAASRGMAVIVMEPLFGGTLASPPPTVQAIWDESAGRYRPADLALQWLWNKPEVSLVLSGMSTLAQVQENVASAAQSGVGRLDAEGLRILERVRAEYRRLTPIPCTKCGYCAPCPQGVDIPLNFELFNQATVYQGSSGTLCRIIYNSLPAEELASACVSCGTCEERCPQQIPIRQTLAQVHEQLGAK
jgi:predicted aldo/keto reductase-like oxidoreductase